MTDARPSRFLRAARFAPLLAAVVAVAAGCGGRNKAAATKGKGKGPYVAVLDLRGGVPEQDAKNMLGLPPKRPSHYVHFRYRTQKLAEDAALKGVFVEFGGGLGFAKAQEVGEDLAKLKAKGIPVHCYSNDWGNGNYLAASVGCSKLIVSPAGEVSTIGIAGQVVYLHKFLVETIGISIDFLQVGKFKGAEEPLTRDGPTPEARQSLEGYLSDTRALWLDLVTTGRPKVAKDLLEDGPYAPLRAKELGVVDEVGYADDALDTLKKEAGAERAVPLFGPKERDEDPEGGDVFKALAGGEVKRAPVVVIRATGSIAMSSGGGGLGGDDGITDKGLGAAIAEVDGDDAVKAVVLRIDSPGGSALASDLLWHKLMKLRKKKPLIVSVGGMAASGGYYLASTGDTIFAEPTSLVGSIGVVGGKIGFGPALERWGIHTETFPAKVGDEKAKARAAAESPMVAWDDATRERILQSMTSVYDLFLRRLEEGRKKPRSAIEPHAEGRIFSGRDGKARGLVDELGGLGAALAKAREAAKLPADAKAEVYEDTPKLLEVLGADPTKEDGAEEDEVSLGLAALEQGGLTKKLNGLPAPLGALARGTLPLAKERVVLTLPFALEVR